MYLVYVQLLSVQILLLEAVVVLDFSKIEHGKWARLLPQNQIREIVIDSDSDEEKYYTSADTEDEEKPHHLHEGLLVHSLQAQIFLSATLKMRMVLVMWQVNSHNPACGHSPLSPEGV